MGAKISGHRSKERTNPNRRAPRRTILANEDRPSFPGSSLVCSPLGIEPGTSDWWWSRPVWVAILFVLLLPVALLLSPLERRGRPADAPIPAAARQIAGALMICLGVATLALYGYGGGPYERLDLISFSLVIVGSGISGLLPKLR